MGKDMKTKGINARVQYSVSAVEWISAIRRPA